MRPATRDRSGVLRFDLVPPKHALRHVVAPEIGGAEVAEATSVDLWRVWRISSARPARSECPE